MAPMAGSAAVAMYLPVWTALRRDPGRLAVAAADDLAGEELARADLVAHTDEIASVLDADVAAALGAQGDVAVAQLLKLEGLPGGDALADRVQPFAGRLGQGLRDVDAAAVADADVVAVPRFQGDVLALEGPVDRAVDRVPHGLTGGVGAAAHERDDALIGHGHEAGAGFADALALPEGRAGLGRVGAGTDGELTVVGDDRVVGGRRRRCGARPRPEEILVLD